MHDRNHANTLQLIVDNTVSGTISLPAWGAFHLSLTVLFRYRSSGSIQPYDTVVANSHGISRVPQYSGDNSETSRFHLQGFHLLWRGFPTASINVKFCDSAEGP